VNGRMLKRLDALVSEPLVGIVPVEKTPLVQRVVKTDFVSWVLVTFYSLGERKCVSIFSPSWAGLHVLFFHPASQIQLCANRF
jgi:hypothetical protein